MIELPTIAIEPVVRAALVEDIGSGDITTDACIGAKALATATVFAKSAGVVAGLSLGEMTFRLIEPTVQWDPLVRDGAVTDGDRMPIARIYGSARSLLTGERVALNFMQRLSGIATTTARFVDLVSGTKARIVDTRKTTPGLRLLEKYAVRVGGGHNHRFGLYDCILIKDNHIAASGGIAPAVRRARENAPHTMKVEVETTSLLQVDEALAAGADIILLDNMDIETLAAAVRRIGGHAITEASGGVNESTVAAIAATGVDTISVGALTHSAPSMDISLDFVQ